MNWQEATNQQIDNAVEHAFTAGRGIMVSPKWLKQVWEALYQLAQLSAEKPLFDNPLVVFKVQGLRDDILRGYWPGAIDAPHAKG